MKKAELTTQQLITIIVLIVSFSVLLFFIFRLNLGGETTNKEICHNSVLLKSKQSFGGALDCRTNYICISGGDKCEDFSATDTVKIDMGQGVDYAKNQTIKAIADEMADCWWMFGEGKVIYAESLSSLNCAICSVVKFDKQIQDKVGEISSDNFYDYLLSKKDESTTYIKYLYSVSEKKNLKFQIENIKTNEKYSIVTGIGGSISIFGVEIGDATYIQSQIIKSSEITSKLSCSNFDLTKA